MNMPVDRYQRLLSEALRAYQPNGAREVTPVSIKNDVKIEIVHQPADYDHYDSYTVHIDRGGDNAKRIVVYTAPKIPGLYQLTHLKEFPWLNKKLPLEERLELAARHLRKQYIDALREGRDRKLMIERVQCKVQPGPCIERLELENHRLRLEAGEDV